MKNFKQKSNGDRGIKSAFSKIFSQKSKYPIIVFMAILPIKLVLGFLFFGLAKLFRCAFKAVKKLAKIFKPGKEKQESSNSTNFGLKLSKKLSPKKRLYICNVVKVLTGFIVILGIRKCCKKLAGSGFVSMPTLDLHGDVTHYSSLMSKLRSDVLRWQLLCFLSCASFLFFLFKPVLSNRIVRVGIEGEIVEYYANPSFRKKIDEVIKSKRTKLVIFSINSPGGSVGASEALHRAIRDVSKKKPTIAIIRTIGASGGYMAAIGTDQIWAMRSSIVGSVGTALESLTAEDLASKNGVKNYQFTSGDQKRGLGGMFNKPTELGIKGAQELINVLAEDFISLVKERRNLSEKEISIVKDARIFTGVQAKKYKLVDFIGTESDAIAKLIEDGVISKRWPIEDLKLDDPTSRAHRKRSNALSSIREAIFYEAINALLGGSFSGVSAEKKDKNVINFAYKAV